MGHLAEFAKYMPNNKFKINERRISGIDTCLEIWSSNIRRGKYADGIKSMSLLCGEGDGYGDSDTLDARQESKVAIAVDNEIMSLSMAQSWAIWKARGVSSVWRFPNLNYEKTLLGALEILEARLRKNSETWHLF